MAINCYLAKKHRVGGLWPATLEGEALALQWSFWTVAELEKPLFVLITNAPGFATGEPDAAAVAAAKTALERPFSVLEAALAKARYLLGAEFSIADLNAASVLNWGVLSGFDFAPFPHVVQWLRTCLERPASARAATR